MSLQEKEEVPEISLSYSPLFSLSNTEEATSGHNKKVTNCKPGKELSPDAKATDTFILELPPPEG